GVSRHTRVYGDWSSGVCSSDLGRPIDPARDYVEHVPPWLDELIVLERLAVAEAAELHLPRRHVLDVIARRIDRSSGLEHERLEPALAQLLGGPPARDAGPYDDGVEDGGGEQKSHADERQRPSWVQPLNEQGIPAECR